MPAVGEGKRGRFFPDTGLARLRVNVSPEACRKNMPIERALTRCFAAKQLAVI
jgi:hypothetical protein